MEEQGRNIVNHRRSRRVSLIPYHPRSLPFHDAEPSLYPDLMPCWLSHSRVLHRYFKDICRLVFRSGFQAIQNLEALTLFREGITIYHSYLQKALPSSHRSREENIHVLSNLEAKVNDFRDKVIQALQSYAEAINLDDTIELDLSEDEEEEQLTSSHSENEDDAIMEDEEHEDEDIDAILERIEQEGGAANLDDSLIILD